MKQIAFALLVSCCLGSSAFAQVAPAATSTGALAQVHGFDYAFRYSETALFYPKVQTIQASIVSGTLAYTNRTLEKPFTMTYAGGYTWTLTGPAYQTGQFHRMFLSQGINARRWKLLFSDNVAYSPQSPTTGFSGIPGIGEVIGAPNPSPSTSQAILTVNTHVLNNSALAQFEHTLNFATSVTMGGTSDILFFPNHDGIDTRSASANGYLTRRISARTSFGGRYTFTQFEYPGTTVAMHTSTVLGGVNERITRNLSVSEYFGPQWIDSTVLAVIPTQTTYAANASVNYTKRLTTFSGTYNHGTNGGSGYFIGGTVDNVDANVMRRMTPDVTLGFSGGYLRNASFNTFGATNAEYGATQVTWQVGRNLIVFGNYTGRTQSSNITLPGNVLNDTIHSLSFGFGLSPREARVRP